MRPLPHLLSLKLSPNALLIRQPAEIGRLKRNFCGPMLA